MSQEQQFGKAVTSLRCFMPRALETFSICFDRFHFCSSIKLITKALKQWLANTLILCLVLAQAKRDRKVFFQTTLLKSNLFQVKTAFAYLKEF